MPACAYGFHNGNCPLESIFPINMRASNNPPPMSPGGISARPLSNAGRAKTIGNTIMAVKTSDETNRLFLACPSEFGFGMFDCAGSTPDVFILFLLNLLSLKYISGHSYWGCCCPKRQSKASYPSGNSGPDLIFSSRHVGRPRVVICVRLPSAAYLWRKPHPHRRWILYKGSDWEMFSANSQP